MMKRTWGMLAAALLVAACGGDSTDEGGGPDLTGTWDLITVDIGNTGTAIGAPAATGQFVFSGTNTVDITLNITSPPAPQVVAVSGTGTYTQTKTKLNINSGIPLIGQAAGTYTFETGAGPNGGDLLTVDMLASGQHTIVVVER